jgi:hypothetical protein
MLRQSNGDPNSDVARLQSNALKWGLDAIDGNEASEAGRSDGVRPPPLLIASKKCMTQSALEAGGEPATCRIGGTFGFPAIISSARSSSRSAAR